MSIRSWSARMWHRLRHAANFFRNETPLAEFTPRGHYHSPLPDIRQSAEFSRLAMRRSAIQGLPGLRLDGHEHKLLIERMIGFAPLFDWPEAKLPGRRYYTANNWFALPDGFSLFAVMQFCNPKKVIEIGSGYSSALMLDIREFKTSGDLQLVFIEPHPQRLYSLLRRGDSADAQIIEKTVQSSPPGLFETLGAGDILFADSSHVSRAGSDLNYILFEILPRLAVGVWIHFHDVFWPFEYPAEWIEIGLAWNEAYLLRAFLQYNSDFEVSFWPAWAAAIDAERVAAQLASFDLGKAQSIWIRRSR